MIICALYLVLPMQVSVELTSDNKDFKTALARTKIAEMKGAKLISLSTLKKRNMKSKDIPRRKNQKEHTISKDVRSFGEVRSHQGEERNHQRIASRTDYSNVGGVAVRTHPSTDVGNNEGASQDEVNHWQDISLLFWFTVQDSVLICLPCG